MACPVLCPSPRCAPNAHGEGQWPVVFASIYRKTGISRQARLVPLLLRVPGVAVFKATTQAESHNSICLGGKRWGAYLRRKERANSFASRESSSVLIITHVWKHNEVSEIGFTTTPSA